MMLKKLENWERVQDRALGHFVKIVGQVTGAQVVNLTDSDFGDFAASLDAHDEERNILFIADSGARFSPDRRFESVLFIENAGDDAIAVAKMPGILKVPIADSIVLFTASKQVCQFLDAETLDLVRLTLLYPDAEGASDPFLSILCGLLEKRLQQFLRREDSAAARREELLSSFASLVEYSYFQDYKVSALSNDSNALIHRVKGEIASLQEFFNSQFQVSRPRMLWQLVSGLMKGFLGIKFHDPRNIMSERLKALCDIKKVEHPEFNDIIRQYWKKSAWSFFQQATSSQAARQVKSFKYQPLISVIVTVYNVEADLLAECIRSILNQSYPNLELLIVDDNSSCSHVAKLLEKYPREDSRVKVIFNAANMHICRATNVALEQASGEFVTFVDHDDTITRNALLEMVTLLNKNSKLDFMYSDEDLITQEGLAHSPIYKPDWSPEMMLSMMYTTHLALYRTKLAKEIGGYREGYEGAQDYDFVLRLTERIPADHIAHIPKVLYHWRMIEGSTALGGAEAKPYALESSRRAVEDAIRRRKLSARRADGVLPFSHRVIHEIRGNPLVSIIIPFRDQPEFLKRCVESVLEKSSYTNVEIILVDNDSRELATKELLEELQKNTKVRVLSYKRPFNYAAINNVAAREARGDYLCLLNNDVEVISPEWLSSLLEYAQQPDIGAVGAKLLYPDGRVQHGGIILGLGGYCAHSHRFSRHDDFGFMGRLVNVGNVLAVTGACLLVSKEKFLEVEGLDEVKFPIAYNDVDFCLKLHDKGYRNIFNPYAKLYHYESVSRGEDNLDIAKSVRFSFEKENLKQKWGAYITHDPYYNPNLTRDTEDFSLRDSRLPREACSPAFLREALADL